MSELVSFDEGSHFISCLQLVDQHMRQRHKDATNVRWIVVGLHDALYTLLIEKVVRTDGFGIFNDKFEAEVGEFYMSGKNSSGPDYLKLKEKSIYQSLAGIGKLLSRVELTSGAEIRTQEIEALNRPSRGISRLKSMRDFLAHPAPMIAGYFDDFILECIEDTVEVIREVMSVRSRRAPRHDSVEANLLISSISFYLKRWVVETQANGT